MFDTILLAVDGSKPAEKAVELAARIAKADGDEIVVVHVTERLPYREVQPPPEGHPEEDRRAIQLAEQYAKDLEAGGLRARVDLRHTMYGSAARLILDAAKEHGAGLIVMALVATPILRPAGGQRGPQGAAPECVPRPHRTLTTQARGCRVETGGGVQRLGGVREARVLM